MFVLGVIIGPAVGLAIGYLLSGSRVWRGWLLAGGMFVLLLVIAIIPIGDVGFRLGLMAGLGLGVLVYLTPIPAVTTQGVVFQPDGGVPPESGANGL